MLSISENSRDIYGEWTEPFQSGYSFSTFSTFHSISSFFSIVRVVFLIHVISILLELFWKATKYFLPTSLLIEPGFLCAFANPESPWEIFCRSRDVTIGLKSPCVQQVSACFESQEFVKSCYCAFRLARSKQFGK